MSGRILWVDTDAMAIRGITKDIKRSGYKVDTRLTCRAGYEVLNSRNCEYDCLIAALIMPDDPRYSREKEEYVGLEFIEEARELCPNLSILVYSVIAGNETKKRAKELGANEYLVKRGTLPPDLTAAVESAMGIQ